MKIRALAIGALVVVSALGLSACSPGSTPTKTDSSSGSSLQDLITAAKAEGSLTWYTADGDGANAAEAAAFGKTYGIQVNILRLTVDPLIQRLASELQSGVKTADVLTVADTVVFTKSADWFVPMNEKTVPGWDAYPEIGKSKTYVLLRDLAAAITYNTKLVPANKVPKTWTDLLDPFWKGHLLLSDPRPLPSYMGWAKVMRAELGGKFLTGIKAQNPQLVASSTPGSQSVAAGSAYAVFPSRATNSSELRQKGAPLAFVPIAGAGATIASGVLKTAPHPNAALLFQAFQMSKEGVAAICATNEVASFYPEGEVPGCLPLEKNWKLPDFSVTDKERATILSELGIGQ